MNWSKTLLLCALGGVFAGHDARARGQETEATPITRYRQAVDAYRRIVASVHVQDFALTVLDPDDTQIPPDRLAEVYQNRFWRNGNEIRLVQEWTRRTMEMGRLVERTQSLEQLVTGDRSVSVFRDPKSAQYRGSNAVFRADPPGSEIRHCLGVLGLPVFEGAIDHLGPRLCDQLETSKQLRIQSQSLEGNQLVRIDHEDNWGRHTVWLDPRRGHHPIRIVQQKCGSQWIAPTLSLDRTPAGPHGRIVSVDTEVIINTLQQVGDAWFARDFVINTKTVMSNSRFIDHKKVVTVQGIDRNPPHSGKTFSIQTSIPNGSLIYVDGEYPIRYEWQSGAIVKSIDQSAADSLTGYQFHGSGRWWLWPCGVLGLAAVAWLLMSVSKRRQPTS